MPMQRASVCTDGSSSTEPSGQTTSTSLTAAPYCSIRAAASTSSCTSTTWCGWPLRARKLRKCSTAGDCGWPISTGPLWPASISPTRRRIRARTSRSPRSASAMMSARSWPGRTSSVRVSATACTSTSAGRPDSVPTSAVNWPGPWRRIGTTWPRPSRWLIDSAPSSTTNMPWLGPPAAHTVSPRLKSCGVPKRRMRAMSASLSTGNIWWRRLNNSTGAFSAVASAVCSKIFHRTIRLGWTERLSHSHGHLAQSRSSGTNGPTISSSKRRDQPTSGSPMTVALPSAAMPCHSMLRPSAASRKR